MSRSKEYFRALPALGLALLAFGLNAQDTTFSAKLTGAAHLPEPIVTKAEGDLVLSLSPDGKKLSYTVTFRLRDDGLRQVRSPGQLCPERRVLGVQAEPKQCQPQGR